MGCVTGDREGRLRQTMGCEDLAHENPDTSEQKTENGVHDISANHGRGSLFVRENPTLHASGSLRSLAPIDTVP